MAYAWWALIALGALALWLAARAAITVCVLAVSDGEIRVVRGGIAPRLLVDLGDVVKKPRVTHGTVRITRDGGRAAVALGGAFTAAQQQQIRNVIGSVPLAMLGNARKKR